MAVDEAANVAVAAVTLRHAVVVGARAAGTRCCSREI